MKETSPESSGQDPLTSFGDFVEMQRKLEQRIEALEQFRRDNFSRWKSGEIYMQEYMDTEERIEHMLQQHQIVADECTKRLEALFQYGENESHRDE